MFYIQNSSFTVGRKIANSFLASSSEINFSLYLLTTKNPLSVLSSLNSSSPFVNISLDSLNFSFHLKVEP